MCEELIQCDLAKTVEQENLVSDLNSISCEAQGEAMVIYSGGLWVPLCSVMINWSPKSEMSWIPTT